MEENDIQKEQQKASEDLLKKENSESQKNDENLKNAKKSQKNAAKKMKKMSEQMQSAMQGGSGGQLQEDVDMLRQVLDNVLLFSFDQEKLMKQFELVEENHNKFASYLKGMELNLIFDCQNTSIYY